MALGEHYVGLFANALPFIGDVIRSLIVPSSRLVLQKNRYHGQRDILIGSVNCRFRIDN